MSRLESVIFDVDGTVEDSGNRVAAATAAGPRCVAVRNPYTAEDNVDGATPVADVDTRLVP